MKKVLSILLVLISLSSCINKSLISTTESEIADYAKCNNYESFHKWYYKAGYTIIDDGVTWGFYKAMPYTYNDDLYLNIELVDGIAEYHKEEFIKEKVNELLDHFKDNGNVINIDSHNDWIEILIKNDKHLRDN